MNTIIAAAAGGKIDFFHCLNFQGRSNFSERFLDGILGGLLKITVYFNVISGLGALAVGIIAGVVRSYSFDLVIKKWRDSRALIFAESGGALAAALFDA
tara:strand:- start:40 stop:336 length:297 start_codon:yes stop_codon:yes gene_type:complete